MQYRESVEEAPNEGQHWHKSGGLNFHPAHGAGGWLNFTQPLTDTATAEHVPAGALLRISQHHAADGTQELHTRGWVILLQSEHCDTRALPSYDG